MHILEKKVDGKLFTKTGKIIGEKSMNADIGERTVVENTKEILQTIWQLGGTLLSVQYQYMSLEEFLFGKDTQNKGFKYGD